MTDKGKYGHLKLTKKVDQSLYFFCRNLREAARRALLTGVHHCPIIHLGGPPLGERLVAKKTKTSTVGTSSSSVALDETETLITLQGRSRRRILRTQDTTQPSLR